MRGNELKHDIECEQASRSILNKWRNGEWTNNFIDQDIRINTSSTAFPSPDQCFYSNSKKTGIALEFKPAERETKRGILTGLGQTIAYLKDSNHSASALVIPEKIGNDNFPIGNFMKSVFEEQIYGKLPIALYSFKTNNPSNVILLCNISNKLKPENEFDFKRTNTTYWAAWRENYPSVNFNLLKTAYEETSKGEDRINTIWKKFYKNYYCYPENTTDTLDLLNSKLFTWDKPIIWAENIKKKLSKAKKEGVINEEQAIVRLKWHASTDQKEKDKYWPLLDSLPEYLKPRHNRDNDFDDQKKNKRNNITHCGLWKNENWELTEVGREYVSRINKGFNELEEMAIIMLGSGRYGELIRDIQNLQKFTKRDNQNEFLGNLKEQFINRGYIGVNPNRAESGSRKFLQSERQIMKRFNLLKMNDNKFFFKDIGFIFNQERVNKLLDIYYNVYGKKIDLAA